jgi:opacity protein-like surface antigen
MARLGSVLIAVAWFVTEAGSASAMEMTSTANLPEASTANLPDASEVLGWYGDFSTGRSWISDFSVCLDETENSCSSDMAFNDGLVYEASIGRALRNGFRLQGELSERRDPLGELADGQDQAALNSARLHQFSFMLSGIYDFRNQSALTPYVGAGLGGVRVDVETRQLEEGFDFSEQSAWKLGFQGFAGLQYEVTPDLHVGLRYSHKVINKAGNFDSSIDMGENENFSNRALTFSLTYEFGGP